MQRRLLLSSATVLAGALAVPRLAEAAEKPVATPLPAGLSFRTRGLVQRTNKDFVSRFAGTVTVTKFLYDGQLAVEGLISGVVQGSGPRKNVQAQKFTALATLSEPGGGVAALATCSILDLDIGAIHLDLLGLVIDVAPIHIDITAVPGGGVLGELLCALADLLGGIDLGNLGNVLDLLGDLLDTLNAINAILDDL